MWYRETVERVPRYTFEDYQAWNDGQRRELLAGQPYLMSPGARPLHQRTVGRLFATLMNQLKDHRCEPFTAPLDVKLSDYDVVQPDLMVVCDPAQVQETHVEGPPALVVEVLSPSTARHDRIKKTAIYSAAGVKEYWLVTPMPPMVEVLLLNGEHYSLVGAYSASDTLVSPSFRELSVALGEVFDLPEEFADEVREAPSVPV